MARLLITGGAGFLGSHTCLVLLQAGHRLVVLDSFANSSPAGLERVVRLAGSDADQRLTVLEGDIRCREHVEHAFAPEHQGGAIEAAIHFAGLKAVAESTAEPLRYWDVNVGGSRLLLEVMQARGCRTLVFSSSATVYGMPVAVPIAETAPVRPINPYGQTKAAVEQLLADLHASDRHASDRHASDRHASDRHASDRHASDRHCTDRHCSDGLAREPEAGAASPGSSESATSAREGAISTSSSRESAGAPSNRAWKIARLRYFNPVGAHPSGQLGEDPRGTPSNLFPLLGQVALGLRERLEIYGDDWPTADGTGERDFIHVMDLAEGHLAALNHLQVSEPGLLTLNLGSGRGHTVQQVIHAYQQACGRPLHSRVVGRRDGDAARSVADPSLAQRLLGWQCRRSLQEMCSDSWRWQSGQARVAQG